MGVKTYRAITGALLRVYVPEYLLCDPLPPPLRVGPTLPSPSPLAAINVSLNLNKVSDYKHKSWYIHMIVFVVPRQISMYGNTWRFSTAAIESRGARLKRLGRRVVCWRRSIGATKYLYTDRRTGKTMERTQSYKSSAMLQLLTRVCGSEDSWHSNERFSRPEKLRLQAQLRSCRLKFDVGRLAPKGPSPAAVLVSEAAKPVVTTPVTAGNANKPKACAMNGCTWRAN